jgi:carbon-monoxide dehydrogenase small subunit
MTKVTMTVNGQSVSAETEGRTLLSAYLREGLGLTGTHIGCDTSQCGACVVHIDGVAVKSCSVFAQDVAGSKVTTIEGMANADGSLGVIQQAFQDHHGLQCGFCTPGMVMCATALLEQGGCPSRSDIRAHISGNYCRCTGYEAIVDAIEVTARTRAATTKA